MSVMERRVCDGWRCTTVFYTYANRTNPRRYCSDECRPDPDDEPPTDEDDEPSLYRQHHNPEDGYDEWREAVLEEAGYTCQAPDCGITDEEHRERDDLWPWNGGLHAHHIVDVREFEDPADAHTLDNGVALCDRHHRQATRGDLTFE